MAITGTPGTGKTTLAEELRCMGRHVIDLNRLAQEKGLLGEYDAIRDTYEVDIDLLDQELPEGDIIIEGHLSHLLDVDTVLILRCDPRVLEQRLEDRGYLSAKVRENAMAEALDVILVESLESDAEVLEVDATHASVKDLVKVVEDILAGEKMKYGTGNIDWSGVLMEWC